MLQMLETQLIVPNTQSRWSNMLQVYGIVELGGEVNLPYGFPFTFYGTVRFPCTFYGTVELSSCKYTVS